jgi:uncharacterized membrane protein YkvA (DUF1232 family)
MGAGRRASRVDTLARVKRDLSRRIMELPLRTKLRLLWRMFRDPAVPARAKSVLPVIVVYLAFPFDIIPDFIPLLGQLDDLAVIVLGLGLFLLLTPRDIIERHLAAFE